MRAAARQRDQQAVGHVALRHARLLGEGPVGVDHDPRRVEDLLDMHVHGPRHRAELGCDLLRDAEIRVGLGQRPRDLDVDRRGETEVEDLVHDVGRLGEELELREALGQLVAQRPQIPRGRGV